MTFKIDGNKGIGPLAGLGRSPQEKAAVKKDGAKVEDKVEFSSVLQQVGRGKEASSAAASSRAEKVQALKAQVASGNYQPDLEKVAASLLQFIAREKG